MNRRERIILEAIYERNNLLEKEDKISEYEKGQLDLCIVLLKYT